MQREKAEALLEEYRSQCRQTMYFRSIQAGFREARRTNEPGFRAAENNEEKSLAKEYLLQEKILKALTR